MHLWVWRRLLSSSRADDHLLSPVLLKLFLWWKVSGWATAETKESILWRLRDSFWLMCPEPRVPEAFSSGERQKDENKSNETHKGKSIDHLHSPKPQGVFFQLLILGWHTGNTDAKYTAWGILYTLNLAMKPASRSWNATRLPLHSSNLLHSSNHYTPEGMLSRLLTPQFSFTYWTLHK